MSMAGIETAFTIPMRSTRATRQAQVASRPLVVDERRPRLRPGLVAIAAAAVRGGIIFSWRCRICPKLGGPERGMRLLPSMNVPPGRLHAAGPDALRTKHLAICVALDRRDLAWLADAS